MECVRWQRSKVAAQYAILSKSKVFIPYLISPFLTNSVHKWNSNASHIEEISLEEYACHSKRLGVCL